MPSSSAACARIRRSRTGSRSGSSSDNLRKGAALNAVQIAEHLAEHELVALAPSFPLRPGGGAESLRWLRLPLHQLDAVAEGVFGNRHAGSRQSVLRGRDSPPLLRSR